MNIPYVQAGIVAYLVETYGKILGSDWTEREGQTGTGCSR